MKADGVNLLLSGLQSVCMRACRRVCARASVCVGRAGHDGSGWRQSTAALRPARRVSMQASR